MFLILKTRPSSPTTTTYEGIVKIHLDVARKQDTDYRVTLITLTFVNDQLRKTLLLKYPVDVVVRRKLTMDPPQVLFTSDGPDQKRAILVQGENAIQVDSVRCVASSVRATVRSMDEKTLIVEIAFLPRSVHGDLPKSLTCDLLSSGKTIASIPVNIIEIH
jgi:hypothetical protein